MLRTRTSMHDLTRVLQDLAHNINKEMNTENEIRGSEWIG